MDTSDRRKGWRTLCKPCDRDFRAYTEYDTATVSIENNITLIHNGVNVSSGISDTGYLHSLGLTEYSYILAVGRLVKEKGFDKLVEAFKEQSPSSVKLVIAGDADHQDEYAQKLKGICQREENILLTGFIKGDKLAQLYAYARIFVLPSTHEGLPIALLEAMSYGCPILASDIPANKEIGLPDECYFKMVILPACSKH